MDSYAISLTASLFVEYTEKKTCFSNSAGILGQHDIVVLADVPLPHRKVGFCLSCNFSNLFPRKYLRMTQNGQFHLICNFCNHFPPKWLRITWNGQFFPIRNFSNLFPPKWLRVTWNGQFCLIHNFSNLFPPKWLRIANSAWPK